MPQSDLNTHVAGLNEWYRRHSANAVLTHALNTTAPGKLALVSSFGAESVVLLHMVSVLRRDTPVIFIDTQMLFAQTLVYQQELAERLGLSNLRIIRAIPSDLAAQDPDGHLHKTQPDVCCHLRKTAPLEHALAGFDGWITGRKRYQGGARTALEFFETEAATGRMKVNPLAHWAPQDVQTYIEENRLPRHPLVADGFASIGCMPCTTPTAQGEDPRTGRWRGQQKTECGLHLSNGHLTRTGENA